MRTGRNPTIPPALPGRQVALAILGALLVQAATARLFFLLLPEAASQAPALLLICLILLPALAMLAWLWLATLWREAHGPERIGLAPSDRHWMRWGVLTGMAAVVLGLIVTNILWPVFGKPAGLPDPMHPAFAAPTPAYVLIYVLSVCLASAIAEEITFRGLLYGWLRRTMTPLAAAFIAAVAHALVHFDMGALPGLIVIFILFGLLYERAQSLWPAILAHGLHNFVVMILAFSRHAVAD